MKFLKIVAAATLLASMLLTAVACKDKNTTPPPAATPEEPRFDYFAIENFGEYISLDKSVYENMKIELDTDFTVGEKEIGEYIDLLCFNKRAKTNGDTKVTKEAIKRGDSAFIFYKGVKYDPVAEKYVEFDGGSNMDDTSPYELVIGSGSFIDGFEDALIGVVPSETGPEDTIAIDLTFPEDYHESSLAGVDVTFYVYVSWTVQYTIPEYNEKFIKETLKFEAKTDDVVAEHKESIKTSLEAEFESAKNQSIEYKIWETLYKEATIINYPASEVKFFYDSYYSDVEQAMTMYSYYGYTFKDINEFARWYMGLAEDADWKAELDTQAKKAVAQTLIYHAIADACGIVVTDEQFNNMVQQYIDYYKSSGKDYDAAKILELVGETPIKEGVLYQNVVDFIEKNATITVKPAEDTPEA